MIPRRLGTTAIVMHLLLMTPGPAGSDQRRDLDEGLRALEAGRLDDASAAFERATATAADAATAFFDLGIVRARQGRAADAAAAFLAAADLAADDERRTLAHYNRGIALVDLGRLQEGLGEFAQALRRSPAYEPARTNYAIVRARLARATPPPPRPNDALSRRLERVPDQEYGFTQGRSTRVRAGVVIQDW